MRAALELFSASGYEPVSVALIAERAGVTTGSLYHHFGGKPQLYELVRTDVERRVADRVEAVLEAGADARTALGPALLAGFDWLTRVGYAGLVGAPALGRATSGGPAEHGGALDRIVSDAVGRPTALLALAAWRAALTGAAADPRAAGDLRAVLAKLLS